MMTIATTLDENYTRITYVMLYSLFCNNRGQQMQVYLLSKGLSESSQNDLKELAKRYGASMHFLWVKKEQFDELLVEEREWPPEACYRLQLLDLLPDNVERLIYLDGDIIVNKNISYLHELPFAEGKHLIVCHDMTLTPESEPYYRELHTERFNRLIRSNRYFNSGMIVMDIPYLKIHYNLATYMNRAAELEYKVYAPDQDLLNDVHKDEVQFVDEWTYDLFACNAFAKGWGYQEVKKNAAIIHYAGDKPWSDQTHLHYDSELIWWEYASQTKYYAEIMEAFFKKRMMQNLPLIEHLRKNEDNNRSLRSQVEELNEQIIKIQKAFSVMTGEVIPEYRSEVVDEPKCPEYVKGNPQNVFVYPEEKDYWDSLQEKEKAAYIEAVIKSSSQREYDTKIVENSKRLWAVLQEEMTLLNQMKAMLLRG